MITLTIYDFEEWYVRKKFSVTTHKEKQSPYIKRNEDLLDVFDIPRVYYGPPVDLKAFLEDKKKEKKEFSPWEILVSQPFKKAYRKLTSSV